MLGWEQMRMIQSGYWLSRVKKGLEEALAGGMIASRPTEPIAHLVVGAVCEGSMMVARADDQRAAADRMLTALHTLLGGLRPRQKSRA